MSSSRKVRVSLFCVPRDFDHADARILLVEAPDGFIVQGVVTAERAAEHGRSPSVTQNKRP